MNHLPRVSVVIPCFNLGHFLEEAIDSVFAQTCRDFEIVVVDDGSTDEDTKRRLNELHRPNTRLIRSENRGLPAARNLGIRHSAGEYVCSLDADDRFGPTWLERGVHLLDSHPELAFVSHWLETFGDEQWDWRPVRCDLGMLLDFNVIGLGAIVRRGVIEAVGGFDESMRDGCEDWEFWIRMTERGCRGTIVPEVMYYYRRRSASMSREMNRSDRHLELYAGLVNRYPESYRRILLDLVLRRERTIADLSRSIVGLSHELGTRLEPAIEDRLREVSRARARLAEIQARQAAEDNRRRLAEIENRLREVSCARARLAETRAREAAEDNRRRLAEMDRERDGLNQRLAEMERERDGLNQWVLEIHRSRSWRLTAPLRWVYSKLMRTGAPR